MLGYDRVGTGDRGIIVLNDWLCDTSTWDPSRPYLDREAFCWVFADVRGYGRSRGQTGAFTVEEIASDVIELASALGWKRFTVVGHSMSTLAALHLAQTQPALVASAVLVTPPPPAAFGYDDATKKALEAVARGDDAGRMRALAVMLGERLAPGWRKFKIDRWRETSDPEAVAGYLAMFGVRGLPDRATTITAPVLAITGEEDAPPMRRDATTQSLAPLCGALEVASISECGHYPMQESPPRFVTLVERFVRAHE